MTSRVLVAAIAGSAIVADTVTIASTTVASADMARALEVADLMESPPLGPLPCLVARTDNRGHQSARSSAICQWPSSDHRAGGSRCVTRLARIDRVGRMAKGRAEVSTANSRTLEDVRIGVRLKISAL